MSSFREQIKLNQQISDEARSLTQQRLAKVSEQSNEKYKSSSRTSYQSMLTERLVEKAATLQHREVEKPSQPREEYKIHPDKLDRMAELNMDVLSSADKLRARSISGRNAEASKGGSGARLDAEELRNTTKLNREMFQSDAHQGLTAANERNRFLETQRGEVEALLAREARERLLDGSKAEIEEVAAKAKGLQRQKLRMEVNGWRDSRTSEAEQSRQLSSASERLKQHREYMTHREERSVNRSEASKFLGD
mmetsp:Transcript_50064/g.98928  ORF Transcript_50064/g.98928 Transcript_50064/m.98928 type:complete len:251 (+) Transcript_50064:22-774(+)